MSENKMKRFNQKDEPHMFESQQNQDSVKKKTHFEMNSVNFEKILSVAASFLKQCNNNGPQMTTCSFKPCLKIAGNHTHSYPPIQCRCSLHDLLFGLQKYMVSLITILLSYFSFSNHYF